MMALTAACIQLNSGNDMAANIRAASELVKAAVGQGATFVLLPENVAYMPADYQDLRTNKFSEKNHPALKAFGDLAVELKTWILVGSLAVTSDSSYGKFYNRAFLVSDAGETVETYDKIHLFDAQVEGGEAHRESISYRAGDTAVVAETPFGKFGLTICYDLRFPMLFRVLAKAGADFIVVPAAFTKITGQAHWEVLLRARAIENGTYILASAQTGKHPGGKETYGHSMIIDPWGRILAKMNEAEGFVMANLDVAEVERVRKGLPALCHDRHFRLVSDDSSYFG